MSGGHYLSGERSDLIELFPAVIAYPALVTPEILWGKEPLELLILGKKDYPLDKNKEQVNYQLKISSWTDGKVDRCLSKYFNRMCLFKSPDEVKKNIHIECISSDVKEAMRKSTLLKTGGRFSGIFDVTSLGLAQSDGSNSKAEGLKDYSHLYYVRIEGLSEIFANDGLYNLFWLYSDYYTSINPKRVVGGKLNLIHDGRCFPKEEHDRLIENTLCRLNGSRLMKGEEPGRFCFHVEGQDVDYSSSDFMNPIQSFHPVSYKRELKHANIAHLSDLHLCSRDQVLAQSNARVIDVGQHDSPPIGEIYNVRSRNVKKLLDKAGEDSSIDIVLITGDLIDYVKSLYQGRDLPTQEGANGVTLPMRNAADVWRAVDLIDNNSYYNRHGVTSYSQNYQEFTDLIGFYSLVVYFYRKFGKPIFVVSGNHDCYQDAYGVSPKILGGLKRANEGIPADQNLTTYEANLMFGESCNTVRNTGNFQPENYEWFYTVLTPFSDFCVQLPNHCIVGLGWGHSEDIVRDVSRSSDDQQGALGHLPRADVAVSGVQLALVQDAGTSKKKLILMSHFTFASYDDGIPLSEPLGRITYQPREEEMPARRVKVMTYGPHAMGTFEKHRPEMYGLENHNVQCVLSGHSHRRGVHWILGTDANELITRLVDFNEYERYRGHGKQKPIMLVSDSAGPIPRYNWEGEFSNWGSDQPSATKISFQDDGNIENVGRVETGYKPRFVVALDYMDLFVENVFKDLASRTFEQKDDDKAPPEFKFLITLSQKIAKIAKITELLMYSYSRNTSWTKVKLQYDGRDNVGKDVWKVKGKDAHELYFRFVHDDCAKERANFLSIKFSRLAEDPWLKQYDFDSRWNFPIEIKTKKAITSGEIKYFLIERVKENPDFEWRRRNFKIYQ